MTSSLDPLLKSEREILWRFAPQQQRSWLSALFGIEQQLEESLRSDLEHSVAHTRLHWWQEELHRLLDNTPRHPLTQTVSAIAQQRGVSPPDLRPLADCVAIDLASLAFETRADLDSYLRGWSSSFFLPATRLDPAHEPVAAAWGAAVRELELLSDFSRHAWQGRVYWTLGHEPSAADPWRARPLGPEQTSALRERLRTLTDTVRGYCRLSDDRPARSTEANGANLARLWSAITLLRAKRACQALPKAYRETRFAPLTLTLQVWWSAVAIQRGKQPTIL